MQIPLKYILRSSVSRRLTTVITILGVALVVFVFSAVLMMANGVQKTLRSTGSDDNLIVVRKAALSEIMSIIDREAAGIVVNLPQVARFPDGRPMTSKEVVVIINLNELGSPGIPVNAVAPGELATPMPGNEDVDPHTVDRPGVPAGRPGDAREVASLIAWLCTDDAAFVTGASLPIDGGLLLVAALRNQEQGD